MLTTPGSGAATPGMWQKDDTLENFGMKPSTSGLWREAKLIDLNDDDEAWTNTNKKINSTYPTKRNNNTKLSTSLNSRSALWLRDENDEAEVWLKES